MSHLNQTGTSVAPSKLITELDHLMEHAQIPTLSPISTLADLREHLIGVATAWPVPRDRQ